MNESDHQTVKPTPVVIGRPRWQVSLADLLLVLTTATIVLAITRWLSRDYGERKSYLLPYAILFPVFMTSAMVAVSFWFSRSRAGRLLCWLRLKATMLRWIILTWVPIAAAASAYIALRFAALDPGAANVSILLLWMFGTGSILNILGGSLRLHEEGIVTSVGLGWTLSSWNRCKRMQIPWRFDERGDLVLGRGWSRVVAHVPPGQQAAVAEILNHKLGAPTGL